DGRSVPRAAGVMLAAQSPSRMRQVSPGARSGFNRFARREVEVRRQRRWPCGFSSRPASARTPAAPTNFAVEIERLRDVIKAMDLKLVTTAAQKLEHERQLLDQDVRNYISGTQAASVP